MRRRWIVCAVTTALFGASISIYYRSLTHFDTFAYSRGDLALYGFGVRCDRNSESSVASLYVTSVAPWGLPPVKQYHSADRAAGSPHPPYIQAGIAPLIGPGRTPTDFKQLGLHYASERGYPLVMFIPARGVAGSNSAQQQDSQVGKTVATFRSLYVSMLTLNATSATLMIVSWLILWRYSRRLRRRRILGLCLACGYDVRHSQARCPECGQSISQSAPQKGP